MKIKTAELQDDALNLVVAMCVGRTGPYALNDSVYGKFSPSTNWAQGGPIIEREGIHTATLAAGIDPFVHQTFKEGDAWEAEILPHDQDSIVFTGPTPLIAAMRCFVARKLGDEVEVPDDICLSTSQS